MGGEGDRYSLVIARDCAIIILMQRYSRGGRMTIQCSAASGPGEASEGKRKVGIKAFVWRGKACGQQTRKKNMASREKGYALLEAVGGL